MKRFFIEIDGRTLEVELEVELEATDGAARLGTPLRVRVGGREVRVDCVETASHELSLIVDGRASTIWVRGEMGSYRVSDRDGEVHVRVEDERDRAESAIFGRKRRASAENEIRAVMPGIVTRVLVEPGGTVEPGTPLLIVEAMKMENELRADAAGVIRSVRVAPGATVNAGDLLVELAPGDGAG